MFVGTGGTEQLRLTLSVPSLGFDNLTDPVGD